MSSKQDDNAEASMKKMGLIRAELMRETSELRSNYTAILTELNEVKTKQAEHNSTLSEHFTTLTSI